MNDKVMNEISVDDLYVEIGKAIVFDETGFLPNNLKGLKERGKRWFSSKINELRTCVCQNDSVRKAANEGNISDLSIAISAAIESVVFGTAISPVSILIVRLGIFEFCNAEWQSDLKKS